MSVAACRFQDVSFSYHDGHKALDGLSLEIQPGEKVAIAGANGAGKSTLLLHLNGILLPAQGVVEIDGIPVRAHSRKEVRRRVGLVFQDPDDQLFCPTVFEDVAFGPRNLGLPEDEVACRVEHALGVVAMRGFETRSGHHLSLGQKKRVAIATVLSMSPSIWAFDEPTANLDSRTQAAIEQFIRGRTDTVIIVTQDLLFASRTCGRVVVLHAGRVELDGPAAKVLTRPGALEPFGLESVAPCVGCEKRLVSRPA